MLLEKIASHHEDHDGREVHGPDVVNTRGDGTADCKYVTTSSGQHDPSFVFAAKVGIDTFAC